jgi:glutaredoxin
MVVHVYGKEGCGKCVAAKDKLARMGFEYREHDVSYHTKHHDGWRDDGSIDVLAAYSEMNTLPLLRVGEQILDYTAAMKVLKTLRREAAAEAELAGQSA